MSTQVTYETQHISLLVTQQCQMLYIFYFYVFYCNLKKKIILEDMWNKYYYYFDLPKFKAGWASATKNSVTFSLHHKIKPIILIIWRHGNFKVKYLRKKVLFFYCFFIGFWPPVPKVILLLQWGWRQIVQQDMN